MTAAAATYNKASFAADTAAATICTSFPQRQQAVLIDEAVSHRNQSLTQGAPSSLPPLHHHSTTIIDVVPSSSEPMAISTTAVAGGVGVGMSDAAPPPILPSLPRAMTPDEGGAAAATASASSTADSEERTRRPQEERGEATTMPLPHRPSSSSSATTTMPPGDHRRHQHRRHPSDDDDDHHQLPPSHMRCPSPIGVAARGPTTNALARKAELEELRRKKLTEQLRKCINDDHATVPMMAGASTSELEAFYLMQRTREEQLRRQHRDAQEYLHNYRRTAGEEHPETRRIADHVRQLAENHKRLLAGSWGGPDDPYGRGDVLPPLAPPPPPTATFASSHSFDEVRDDLQRRVSSSPPASSSSEVEASSSNGSPPSAFVVVSDKRSRLSSSSFSPIATAAAPGFAPTTPIPISPDNGSELASVGGKSSGGNAAEASPLALLQTAVETAKCAADDAARCIAECQAAKRSLEETARRVAVVTASANASPSSSSVASTAANLPPPPLTTSFAQRDYGGDVDDDDSPLDIHGDDEIDTTEGDDDDGILRAAAEEARLAAALERYLSSMSTSTHSLGRTVGIDDGGKEYDDEGQGAKAAWVQEAAADRLEEEEGMEVDDDAFVAAEEEARRIVEMEEEEEEEKTEARRQAETAAAVVAAGQARLRAQSQAMQGAEEERLSAEAEALQEAQRVADEKARRVFLAAEQARLCDEAEEEKRRLRAEADAMRETQRVADEEARKAAAAEQELIRLYAKAEAEQEAQRLDDMQSRRPATAEEAVRVSTSTVTKERFVPKGAAQQAIDGDSAGIEGAFCSLTVTNHNVDGAMNSNREHDKRAPVASNARGSTKKCRNTVTTPTKRHSSARKLTSQEGGRKTPLHKEKAKTKNRLTTVSRVQPNYAKPLQSSTRSASSRDAPNANSAPLRQQRATSRMLGLDAIHPYRRHSDDASVCSSVCSSVCTTGTMANKKLVPLYNGRSLESEKKPAGCPRKWNPRLFSSKAGCERCLHFASAAEKKEFERQGHHYRINVVRGGCHRSCSYFPRKRDERPARLCRKCFYDTHELKLW